MLIPWACCFSWFRLIDTRCFRQSRKELMSTPFTAAFYTLAMPFNHSWFFLINSVLPTDDAFNARKQASASFIKRRRVLLHVPASHDTRSFEAPLLRFLVICPASPDQISASVRETAPFPARRLASHPHESLEVGRIFLLVFIHDCF